MDAKHKFLDWKWLLPVVTLLWFGEPLPALAQPSSWTPEIAAFLNAIAEHHTNEALQMLEANTNLAYSAGHLDKLPSLEAAAAGNIPLLRRLLDLGVGINAQG